MFENGDSKRVGLLVGRENTFPLALIQAINSKGARAGITAEMAILGGTFDCLAPTYRVLIDRISHEVPYYRAHIKTLSMLGTVIINDPARWEADGKFLDCVLARRIGVAVPRTVMLPNKSYVAGISHTESLRNLAFPIDWAGLVNYVGLPAVLKPELGGGWRDVTVVHSLPELLAAYDRSGVETMILQEYVDWDDYLRCICIGGEVWPMRYDPRAPFERRYVADDPPTGELRRHAEKQARALVGALGYAVNSVEFAVKEGRLYAIDFMNPVPDLDLHSIREEAFEWAVDRFSDLAVRSAAGVDLSFDHKGSLVNAYDFAAMR